MDTVNISNDIIVIFDNVNIMIDEIDDYRVGGDVLEIEVDNSVYSISARDLLNAIDAVTSIEELLEKDTIDVNSKILNFLRKNKLI